jgi:hypothetical protein
MGTIVGSFMETHLDKQDGDASQDYEDVWHLNSIGLISGSAKVLIDRRPSPNVF